MGKFVITIQDETFFTKKSSTCTVESVPIINSQDFRSL